MKRKKSSDESFFSSEITLLSMNIHIYLVSISRFPNKILLTFH